MVLDFQFSFANSLKFLVMLQYVMWKGSIRCFLSRIKLALAISATSPNKGRAYLVDVAKITAHDGIPVLK